MAVGTLARLFSALSAECDELAARVEDMHGLFASADATGNLAGDAGFIVAAQDVDFVQQHLAALSEFLMVMAEMTPDAVRVDLEAPLGVVRLADLRRRLAGGAQGEAPVVEAGELELL